MIQTLWERLKTADKKILLYGTGNGADKIIDELNRLNIPVSGVFASDGFVRKRTFRGFPVMSYSQAKELFVNFIVLVSFGSSRSEVISNIMEIAKEQELYSVDVPVYGDNIFNGDFYQKHRNEIDIVRSHLADEKSVNVFDNIINFKLTGNVNLLLDCQTSKTEAYKNILSLSDDEIYMDLGAFNGDTIEEFLSFVNSYNKIYAVEPDKKNFQKLTKNTSEIDKIKYINSCVSDEYGEILFSSDGGRNSNATENGTLVKCETVDNILSGEKVTYIKFDVEGLEEKAIEGAKNSIAKFKPKMMISCYHRSEDIFALPLKVFSIRNDYKLYIRHYPYIPAWDTQFYFI